MVHRTRIGQIPRYGINWDRDLPHTRLKIVIILPIWIKKKGNYFDWESLNFIKSKLIKNVYLALIIDYNYKWKIYKGSYYKPTGKYEIINTKEKMITRGK